MAKLRDDEIRWILSLDAKGVQSELKKISSISDELTKQNKQLENQITSAEGAIKKLRDESKQLTKSYNDENISAKVLMESRTRLNTAIAVHEKNIKTHNLQINDNSKIIAENNAKIDETVRAMKIEDMTMGQLKKRAKELEIQLNNTSKAASPETYKSLDDELKSVRERMGEVKGGAKDAEKEFSFFSKESAKGAAIVAAAVMAIKKGFEAYESVMMSTKGTGVEFKSVMDGLNNTWDYMKAALATMDFSNFLENMFEAYSIGHELTILLDKLSKRRDSFSLTSLPLRAEIEELKTELRDVNLTNDERIAKGLKIKEKTNKLADEEKKILEGQVDLTYSKLKQETKLSEKEADFYIKRYNENERQIQFAEELIQKEIEYQKARVPISLDPMISATVSNDRAPGLEVEIKRMKASEEFSQMAYNSAKKYTLATEETIKNYVQSNKELLEVDIRTTQSLRMTQRTVDSLTKKNTDKELGGSTPEQRQRKGLQVELANQETAHKAELQILKDAKIAEKQTDEQYKIEVAKSDKQYYSDRIKLLEDYREKVSDKKMLADIDKDIVDAKGKSQDLDPIIDKANLDALAKSRDELLSLDASATNGMKLEQEKREDNEKVHSMRLQTLELAAAQRRLEILRNYNAQMLEADITDAKLKEDAIRKSGDAIVAAEMETIVKRKTHDKAYRDADASIRKQYGTMTIDEQMKNELAIQEAWYEDGKISEEAYQIAIKGIKEKYADQMLKTREKYGLVGAQEQYNRELAALQKEYDQKLLSVKEFEEAKGQLKLKYAAEFAKKVNDEIQRYAGMASSAVDALQSAETANLDAQYDARIAAAQGNADEVERLETEKAQKKLDIEKKYADVQFAIKASEIIGNTTVAIMTGYAQLGPIMGSIAAVMLGVTGAAQLVAANAERQKIKSMTLGGGEGKAGSSGRIVAQRAEGKYDVIGEEDGRMYRNVPYTGDAKTGVVSRPTLMGERGSELVVSHPDFKALQRHMNYPLVLQALQDVRYGNVPQRAGGKYDSIDSVAASQSSSDNTEKLAVEKEMLQFLRQLSKPGAIRTDLSLGNVHNGLKILDRENNKFKFGDK